MHKRLIYDSEMYLDPLYHRLSDERRNAFTMFITLQRCWKMEKTYFGDSVQRIFFFDFLLGHLGVSGNRYVKFAPAH